MRISMQMEVFLWINTPEYTTF